MKINGKTVRTSYFTRYCKSRLGYASKPDTSLYELVCMALEIDGMPQPMNISARRWAAENADHIMGRNQFEKLKSCSQKAAKKPRAERKRTAKGISFSGVDVTSKEFLNTYEWRKLRMEALKKYGPKCMCCGATPATGAVMNVDHIKPRKAWPSLAMDINNLQILCHECNHGKGNWDQTDWRE
jgi:5-methylcytosine-specific restriction endonuclease McrA